MTLLERVSAGVVLADGAMGTLGMSRRDVVGAVPALWPLECPGVVEAMHRAYATSGAELILTCTFAASRDWLDKQGSECRVAMANEAAVMAARRGSGTGTLVGGDVGPVSAAHRFEASRARELYHEQIATLVGAGVDAIVLETMVSAVDVRVAIAAANEIRGTIPLVASMTFDRGLKALDGSSPEAFADVACSQGVDVLGTNCCDGPETTLAVVERLARCSDTPLFAKPSAGLPRADGSYEVGPAQFGQWARRLVDSGARIIGGCCGTTPAHIAACRDEIQTQPIRT